MQVLEPELVQVLGQRMERVLDEVGAGGRFVGFAVEPGVD